LSTREDIEITYSNYTRLTRFESVRTWSALETVNLMNWHLEHERRTRKGWNNNLSLINHSICDGEVSYSLLAWQFKPFENMILLVIPFKAVRDVRSIKRMYTTFSMIRSDCKAFSQSSKHFLIGEDREYIINLLIDRIIDSFGWNQQTCHKNKIRRYRLAKVLENSKCTLTSDLDCHHLIGHSSGKLEHIIDDRSKNIKILDKVDHHSLHDCFGDTNFIDYRLL
jgi:hypothetical protein